MKKFLSLVCFSALFTGAIIAQTQYNATTYHQFNTNSGNIQIGARNSSFAHFYTSLPNYYFDKGVCSGGNKFYSYNGSLTLEAASGNFVEIQPRSSSHGLILREYNSSDFGNIEVTSDGLGFGYNNSDANLLIKTNGVIKAFNAIETHLEANKNFQIGSWEIGGPGSMVLNAYDDTNSAHIPMSFAASRFYFHEGQVGIGTINTNGYQLAINGKMICEGVKCIIDVPNSDFVFESNYKLMDLQEVEIFIKENKHLPEMPSAEDFKQNGYNMGEFDDIILRKVEQLTLYIIEQNKKIAELQEQLDKLNK